MRKLHFGYDSAGNRKTLGKMKPKSRIMCCVKCYAVANAMAKKRLPALTNDAHFIYMKNAWS